MSRYAALKQQIATAEEALAAERAKNQQREFSAWLSSDEMKLKVSPAMKADLLPIMEFAAGTERYEFSAPDPADAAKTVKAAKAPIDMIKEFARKYLPDIITFGELATKKKAAGEKPDMANVQELAKQATEFQRTEAAAGRAITITEAVNHVTQR